MSAKSAQASLLPVSRHALAPVLTGSLGNIEAYIAEINRLPMLTRRGTGTCPVPFETGGFDCPQLSRLRPSTRRPDTGRQYRIDESRQTFRSENGRSTGFVCHSLDQG